MINVQNFQLVKNDTTAILKTDMESTLLAREIQDLINRLCKKADKEIPNEPLEGYQLSTRQMGFRISSEENVTRKLGKNIADIMWKDKDGSHAFATLSEDINGKLFELDIWKTNFSKPSFLPVS
jgi:hypothetical protein